MVFLLPDSIIDVHITYIHTWTHTYIHSSIPTYIHSYLQTHIHKYIRFTCTYIICTGKTLPRMQRTFSKVTSKWLHVPSRSHLTVAPQALMELLDAKTLAHIFDSPAFPRKLLMFEIYTVDSPPKKSSKVTLWLKRPSGTGKTTRVRREEECWGICRHPPMRLNILLTSSFTFVRILTKSWPLGSIGHISPSQL